MSAMLGNVPYAVGFGNGTAAPGGFILAAIVLLLFSVGYVAMARLFTTAGGFYGFISHGLGRPLGMAAGWGGMAAYSLFEAGEWGIFAYYTRSTFSQFLHINLAWPVYAFAGLALVAVLTYFDVKLSAKVLGVALILEVVLLLIMDIVILAKGGASGISFAEVSMWSSSGPTHSTSAPTARSTAIITSRSATGGRLRTMVTPGASKAAASCFSPEFFVAPEILIAPESGGPGRTATASIGRQG